MRHRTSSGTLLSGTYHLAGTRRGLRLKQTRKSERRSGTPADLGVTHRHVCMCEFSPVTGTRAAGGGRRDGRTGASWAYGVGRRGGHTSVL